MWQSNQDLIIRLTEPHEDSKYHFHLKKNSIQDFVVEWELVFQSEYLDIFLALPWTTLIFDLGQVT